jgi:PadR family transcriptional regulator
MHAEHHCSTSHHDHGWSPPGPRRRWLEPFLLVLLARGVAHGYALVGRLNALGVAPTDVDPGTLYRTLRDLEVAGLVESRWTTPGSGAPRRDYVLTDTGRVRLSEWAAVMHERARLVGEFLSEYEVAGQGAATVSPSDAEV